MMWLTLRLIASGVFQKLLKALSAALKWLLSDWRNLALAGHAAALSWLLIFTVPGLREDLATTERMLTVEEIAHAATVRNYIDASDKAQADAVANAARVKAEQERITDATVRTYRADIDRLRARFDRLRAADGLRSGAPRTDPGRADAAGLPGSGDAAARTAGAAAQDRLPAPGSLNLDDALIASEQALQLQALIDWITAQSALRFTPEAPEPR
jgi:hypothetical protein